MATAATSRAAPDALEPRRRVMLQGHVPWRPALFKGTRVFARCDDAGVLVAAGGRVEIRYRLHDQRSYRAALGNLDMVPDEQPVADPRNHVAPVGAGPGPAAQPVRRGVPPPANVVVVYADGACSGNPGPAGLGVVLVRGGKVRELSRYLGTGTNNIAELTAIEAALEAIDDTTVPVRLYTDSQYAIGVLTKGWKARANVELVARVRAALGRFVDVELHYVPGHAGVPFNERADALAVRAVSDRDTSGWHDSDG